MKKNMLRAAALVTALALLAGLLTACGNGLEATSMHLKRTEGTVAVSDGEGKELKPREDLGLYSGYQLGTWAESYAWIDLDDVKLTKMDQDSQIKIVREEKHLSIEVKSGSLFFNVTQPLEEDETLDIHTSTMVVGIRGTCGWVYAQDRDHLDLYLLEGGVECSVTDPKGRITTATVAAGETASLSISAEGEGSITLASFDEHAVPDFVLDEVQEDEALSAAIADSSGLELQDWDAGAAFAAALESIGYYGDPAACAMTAEDRAAYARVLREEIAKVEASEGYSDGYEWVEARRTYAGLVDLGNGVPALMFGGALEMHSEYGNYLVWADGEGATTWGMWQLVDGRAVKLDGLDRTAVYADHLYLGGHYVGDPGMSADVRLFEGGRIADVPSTTAQEEWDWNADVEWGSESITRVIDGQPATEAELEAWMARWNPEGSLAGFSHGSDVSVDFWGLTDANSVLSVLEGGSLPSEEDAKTRLVYTLDPSSSIRRTTLDTTGCPLEVYYEIPVFENEGAGYAAINAFFQNLQDQFFSDKQELDSLREMATEGNPYHDTFSETWTARITEQGEKYVSVAMSYFWYMGGVADYGVDGYVFDPADGTQLTLAQVTGLGEAELKETIANALVQAYPEIAQEQADMWGGTTVDNVYGHDADSFDFYLENGQVIVYFDKYEISYGAAGAFEVPLPVYVS